MIILHAFALACFVLLWFAVFGVLLYFWGSAAFSWLERKRDERAIAKIKRKIDKEFQR